jgi:hypothetical protein
VRRCQKVHCNPLWVHTPIHEGVHVLVIDEVGGYVSSTGHVVGYIEGRGVGQCEMKKKRMKRGQKRESEAWLGYEKG